MVLAMLSPSPPAIWCSSAETAQPVLAIDFRIASSSSGLIVWMLITSAEMPCSARIASASMAFQTKCPVAKMVTSVPSIKVMAFPISNG